MSVIPFTPVPRQTLREQVYATLLDAIVSGALPPDSRLRDGDLAAELHVSRTPVREALQRLEDEGLVQTAPGSQTRVTPLRESDAREAVPVVAALHALAARHAVLALTADDFACLHEANSAFAMALDQGDAPGALEADDVFHAVFVARSGNGELRRSLRRLLPRVRRLELARFRALAGRDSVAQHDAIITAAVSGEPRRTGELVEENWLTLGRRLAETFPDAIAATDQSTEQETT
ncbi:MAG: GntR family transcriptional regulator [Chloroflexota bacterium]|nr:GntR family transcriptional regulator [Chloroflexota bacterium]